MSDHVALAKALADLRQNPEQLDAVRERQHCIVLAGPGSGKTKTLTTAMARALAEDVIDPRGVACITYNNECAVELEDRLAKLGVAGDDRSFIGTVHSFALTQVIAPYARCIPGLLSPDFKVATPSEVRAAVEIAYEKAIGDGGDPHKRWAFAETKRRRDVDRNLPEWSEKNPELKDFIEAYEAELRRLHLIDFDDMPLLAFRMIKDHRWIRDALRARFPVFFVDEYQDLGHALHELVLLLCFESGIRLFAVGDTDQSIYSFTGANPELLQSLTVRPDVKAIRLRFNYRSGAKIIKASLGALGEERDYRGIDGAPDGQLNFRPVNGDLTAQAEAAAQIVVPDLISRGIALEQIAVLYRNAKIGDNVANALETSSLPFARVDANAIIKRSSRLARLIEGCAAWASGGWQNADPPFERLLRQAAGVVYGGRASAQELHDLSVQLIAFLRSGIGAGETAHTWLSRFHRDVIAKWQPISRNRHQEWQLCSDLLVRTDPVSGRDMALDVFSGRVEGTGRITLSTLHSAKGREFDAVIMFGVNSDEYPSYRDKKSDRSLLEARRLFYVGVTRPRKELSLVYQEGQHSPWVAELLERSQRA